jgi:hypothetical protein
MSNSVCVLQIDNRPALKYLLLTRKVNMNASKELGYNYMFHLFNNNKYGTIDPKTKKIYLMNEILEKCQCEIIIFMDSDAWIHNTVLLKNMVNELIKNENIQGCISRDPYSYNNTFINSGVFAIKNNDYIKNMFKQLIKDIESYPKYCNKFPHDQFYMSNYIQDHIQDFYVLNPDVFNTPDGRVIRHNWYKNNKMYDDLHKILKGNRETITHSFVLSDYLDSMPYTRYFT